jgi:DNA-binding MarR family transcriptional regulator
LSKHSRAELISEFIAAVRASQTATDMLDDAVARRIGIHRTDYRCLDVLDQEGPMTAGRLAERVRLSPGATTSAVDRLERRGFARRTRDPSDRRRVLVEVTPKLRKLAEQLHGPPDEAVQALSGFTDEQLEFLTSFLHGSIAYQEERIRRLDALSAGDAAETR